MYIPTKISVYETYNPILIRTYEVIFLGREPPLTPLGFFYQNFTPKKDKESCHEIFSFLAIL